jgi:hypothetical protein
MKPALALTLVSSITCIGLATWDAEAKPALHPHAPVAAVKAEAKPAPKGKAKAPAKHHEKVLVKDLPAPKGHVAAHHAGKPEAKPAAKPEAKPAKPHEVLPPVAWKIGDGGGITLQAKVSAEPRQLTTVAHFHAPTKAKTAAEIKAAAAAKKAPIKKSFWIAAEPHVPLAIVDGPAIHSVAVGPKACGAEKRWAKPKSHWKAVDEWGQVAGSFEVAKSEPYDGNRCREIFFKGQPANQPPVLFVSEESGWKASPSVAWAPSEQDVKRFDHIVSSIDELWVNGKPKGKLTPLTDRTLFFQAPAVEGSDKHPTKWAVSGGPVLVVAYLGEHGHWKASEVKAPIGRADAYKPVGVFDMNGDGVPEIVYHMADGLNAADNVLSLDGASMTWTDAASSPGGATH